MNRILGIAVLILALVGLSAPSLSMAAGVSGPVWSVEQTSVSAPTATRLVHCKSLGGKRVLPCHPDQGVIATRAEAGAPAAGAAAHPLVLLPAARNTPEAELPPPRQG